MLMDFLAQLESFVRSLSFDWLRPFYSEPSPSSPGSSEPEEGDLSLLRAIPDLYVAAHEAGHAVVTWVDPYTVKITSIALHEDGGRVYYATSRNQTTASRWYELATALGGIAGEAVQLKRFRGIPAEGDLKTALAAARAVVAAGSRTPPWSGDRPAADHFDVGQMYRNVDDPEVRRVLNLGYARAQAVITRDRVRFKRVVWGLLKSTTLDEAALRGIFGPRPFHL